MKFATTVALGLALLMAVPRARADEKAAPREAATPAELKDARQKASYGVGLDMGKNMKRQGIDFDPDILARGLKDGLAGAKGLLTDEQIAEAMEAYKTQLIAKQKEMARALGEKNKQEGEAYLAGNAKKDGVVTLPSGLQYKVIRSGSGKSPGASDTVTTHYTGTLIDGTVFDSSVKRGQPASFQVNQVIPGWTEALQKMKVGDKWQLVIPSALAYGETPRPGGPIGPNATLIFDVELLGVGEPEAVPGLQFQEKGARTPR